MTIILKLVTLLGLTELDLGFYYPASENNILFNFGKVTWNALNKYIFIKLLVKLLTTFCFLTLILKELSICTVFLWHFLFQRRSFVFNSTTFYL